MRIHLQPVRHCRGRWITCTPDRAQAYELRLGDTNGRRLRREHSLREAERLRAMFDPRYGAPRLQLSEAGRDGLVGKRYSDVQHLVAGRGPIIASTKEPISCP